MDASQGVQKIVSTSSDSSDGDSDEDDREHCDATTHASPLDTLDQDEDIICAAEEAQEEDLNKAAQSAELEVTVTDSEQKAASTTLSKVSIVHECSLFFFCLPPSHFVKLAVLSVEHLLIRLYSSQNLHTRSTTLLAFLKR